METTYELRELCSKDIFPMFKIMGKIGFDEFKGCFETEEVKAAIANASKEGKEIDTSAIGITVFFDIASVIVSHIPSCEDDIYSFLSGLSGMTKKEIADLPLITFTEMIIDVIQKEEFKDFIKVVSKLFK